jgi:hypothetical protein
MPLPVPDLDDRGFDDLVADLLARIPAHTPEWKHVRTGDPGRTLIELFAWLGDTLLFRVNQVPEKQRRVFLDLLGMPLRPARPARGVVALALPDDARDAFDLRERARIDRPLPFETVSEVSVSPVTGEVYVKRRLGDDEKRQLGLTLDQLRELYGPGIEPYEPTPLFTDGLAAPAGVDLVRDTVDRCAWIALFAPQARSGEAQADLNDAARRLLARQDDGTPRLLNVGVVPAITVPDDRQIVADAARIPLLWEMSYASEDGLQTRYGALDVVADSTLGTRRAGVARLEPPGPERIGAARSATVVGQQSGVGTEPPRIDDPRRQARLIGWLRVRPDPGAPAVAALRMAWIGVHAVEIEQRTMLARVVVADSPGVGDWQVQLPVQNVDAASIRLEVAEPGAPAGEDGWDDWVRVDDLATLPRAAARDARAYELDAQAGLVTFGDGMRGRVPPTGSRVRATLAAGGGAGGNLPAASLKQLAGSDVRNRPVPTLAVTQPVATQGGEDAETVEQAEKRIPAALRHRERAVTADDYAVLAQETPGVSVARVEVLPRFKPLTRSFGIPGVVSVMVIPGTVDGDVGTAPNPRADRPLIEAVHAHLDARRPLATELYVIGCEYVPVGVSVAVTLREDAPRDETLQSLRRALRRLLWPLAPGGFDARGWPLGRPLVDREIEVEAARVPGIATVAGVNLFVRAGSAWQLAPRNASGVQEIDLQPWQLPELLDLNAASGDAAPSSPVPDDALAQAGGPELVAIPVVPELC